ncbi:hypothetical protein BaRGS_00016658 [Batillaria attramentaria]|uniref:SCAN box domain-containing protein n=1 Tax=Batillaria attramentaria TaxID=370345 RepID=A0ABD0KYD8_9CAEN
MATHSYSTRSSHREVERERVEDEVGGDEPRETNLVNVEDEQIDASLNLTRSLIEKGKLLELSGTDLRSFVLEEENRLRDERRADADRRARLDELRIRADIARAEENRNNNSRQQPRENEHYSPKLPFYEDKDDIEQYIIQFERFARINAWGEDRWADKLGVLLKGKAREVYLKMDDEEASDYETLKERLLERFQLTAETYRKKFRMSRRDQKDSYKEHVTKLSLWLDRWLVMSGKDKSVNDVKDLMIQEQVLEGMPQELVTYIMDRKPETAKELASLATTYEEARARTKKHTTNGGSSGGNRSGDNKRWI